MVREVSFPIAVLTPVGILFIQPGEGLPEKLREILGDGVLQETAVVVHSPDLAVLFPDNFLPKKTLGPEIGIQVS